MKKLNKYHIVSIALLVLIAIVQLLPFVSTSTLKAHKENEGSGVSYTWAEIPVGLAGKVKNREWPPEVKYRDLNSWYVAEEVKALFEDWNEQIVVEKIDEMLVLAAKDPDNAFDVTSTCEDLKNSPNGTEEELARLEAAKAALEASKAELDKDPSNTELLANFNVCNDEKDAAERAVVGKKARAETAVHDYVAFVTKYPLYGKKNISLFQYVWRPAAGLANRQFVWFLIPELMFIAFALFAFLIKNYMAKAVVGFMFAATQICQFISILYLRSADFEVWTSGRLGTVQISDFLANSSMLVAVLVLIMSFVTIGVSVYFIPQWKRDKAANAELKKKL